MSTAAPEVPHKGLITLSIMLATIMQVLDTTIANVALPTMTGDLGASQDTITWVLTSYIAVSYTHLDVYKRQERNPLKIAERWLCKSLQGHLK